MNPSIDIETHPLDPFLPPNAKVLILGSFPPPQNRWKMNFYYPNFNNDMWRIIGKIFFNNAQHFIAQQQFREHDLRQFLAHRGIALYDTARHVQRLQHNAADHFLRIIEPSDIARLLAQLPDCHHIITTGELATQTLLSTLPEESPQPPLKTGQTRTLSWQNRSLYLHRLPSTSRAYPLPFDQKVAIYHHIFEQIFLDNQ